MVGINSMANASKHQILTLNKGYFKIMIQMETKFKSEMMFLILI
jgi:hypothetical protein